MTPPLRPGLDELLHLTFVEQSHFVYGYFVEGFWPCTLKLKDVAGVYMYDCVTFLQKMKSQIAFFPKVAI